MPLWSVSSSRLTVSSNSPITRVRRICSHSQSNTTKTKAHRKKDTPAMAAFWKIKQKDPEEYEKDRVSKYAQYFQDNNILPIPEISKALEPQILLFIISDLKTKRVARWKKENFEECLPTADISCCYYCHLNFATLDVLLQMEEQAAKLARSSISANFFQLQPEYTA